VIFLKDNYYSFGDHSSLDDNSSLCAIGYILLHRAARCLYDIISADMPGLTWDEFCRAMHITPNLQDILCAVTSHCIQRFAMDGKFNFQAAPVALSVPYALNGIPLRDGAGTPWGIAREMAETVATSLLLFAQSSHYAQRSKLIQYYTMDDYLAELSDESMSHTLMLGFRDAVARLDFSEEWRAHLDEVQVILPSAQESTLELAEAL
jgi:hypothetical protein